MRKIRLKGIFHFFFKSCLHFMHMLLFFPVRSSHLLDLDELPRSYSKHHQNVIRVQGKLFSQVLALAQTGSRPDPL